MRAHDTVMSSGGDFALGGADFTGPRRAMARAPHWRGAIRLGVATVGNEW
jgi:hypothetical protein